MDSADPFNFGDGSRSPSGVLDVDFSAYFQANPEQQLAFAFEGLIEALRELPSENWLFNAARGWLVGTAQAAYRSQQRGRTASACSILRLVERRADGCAERGGADGFSSGGWSFWRWLLDWLRLDFIDTCDGQSEIHPRVLETLELLK